MDIRVKRPADGHELDEVEAPLPSLPLADEALRDAQAIGHVDLFEACGGPASRRMWAREMRC